MRMDFYARMRKGQKMKHQKRENTGSIVLILDIIIIINIIIKLVAANEVSDTSKVDQGLLSGYLWDTE